MLDEDAFGPLIAWLANAGLDGILAMGTTGEGVLLSVEERERVIALFMAVRPAAFRVIAHTGAQTTADTVRLSACAADAGADGVAVIGPPYFALDEASMLRHFVAAARACDPTPFYMYEFAARSGYAVPIAVIERLREAAPNLRGLKVSDTPFEAVRNYLLDGLEVLVGSEPLALQGMELGAAGTVSGLATAFPELIVSLVRERTPAAQERVEHLRRELRDLPFHAAMKAVIRARGLALTEDVRAPLRGLTDAERARVLALLT